MPICSDSQDYQEWGNIQINSLHFVQGFYSKIAGNNNGLVGTYTGDTAFWHQYTTFGLSFYKNDPTCATGTGRCATFGLDLYPWIGAIVHRPDTTVRAVSVANNWIYHQYLAECEFLGYTKEGDSIWRTSIDYKNVPNRRYFDDDGDGKIDEDELDGLDNDGDWIDIRDDLNHNGKPDHGEPNVDEDYGAISESDIYVAYRDSFKDHRDNHFPLGIKVFQKSYAWKDRVKEPILPFEFYFINQGPYILDSVYLAVDFWAFLERCPGMPPSLKEFVGHFLDMQTVYYRDYQWDPNAPPIGLILLGMSGSPNPLKLTMVSTFDTETRNDKIKYNIMSSGITSRDSLYRYITGSASDIGAPSTLISIGPYVHMNIGDTLKLSVSLVAGEVVEILQNNLRDNARKAIALYNNDWRPPSIPQSPKLRIISGDKKITLDWSWHAEDGVPNVMDTWDDLNHYVNALPITHWRRINPPPGKTKGGRTFEGFKIYRSEYPVFQENQMSLLYQYDVNDDLGFNDNTGLKFTYTDSSVVRGRRYWYAVTAFTIPDYSVSINGDTVETDPWESGIHENAVQVPIPFSPSYELGKVKVVPNPYRTDIDYRYEGGGWEGLARMWDETKRLVWFIHLPLKCTIRIFAIDGSIVATLDHDDNYRKSMGLPDGQEEWHLLSGSHRAIASGIYVFTVESDYGTQIGKFVVIR